MTREANQTSALVVPVYMRQCNKKFPHITRHVQFCELWQVIDEVSALHELEDEGRAIVFAHTV